MQLRFEPRHFLVVLTALALWLAWLVVRPFAGLLFMAAVAATVLSPVTGWVERRVAGRHRAALLLTLVAALAVVGPLAGMGALLVRQASGAAAWLERAAEEQGLDGLIARLPASVRPVAERLAEGLPHGAREAEEALRNAIGTDTFSTVGGLLQATGTALSHLLLFFVALYFFLADGQKLVAWLKEMVPLPAGKTAVLLGYLRSVTISVVASTLATSGLQAVAALVGYALAGVPSALFFGLLTFFTSLIPAVGTMLVWLPLAVLKLATGKVGAAAFLVAWGILVVGMVDNVVKPMLIRRGVSFPVGLVFFALLGGLAAFGPVGLFGGPLVLAFLIATVRAWHDW